MSDMNPAWIHLWFLFLNTNRDYAAYCKARRKRQKAACAKLEKQFPKVAEIYADFGTVYGIKFDDWYKTHKHLFYAATTPKIQVLQEIPKKLDPAAVYIRVPYALPVSKATKQAADAIREAYTNASNEQKQPLHTAKYLLATKVPSYVSWLSTMKCYAAWHYMQPIDGKQPSQKVRVTKMIKLAEQYSDEYWDWNEQSLEQRGGLIDEVRQSTSRFAKGAEHIIANTVHGVFPMKKPLK